MNLPDCIYLRLVPFFLFFYSLPANDASAQQNGLYSYNDLSQTAYSRQKDSLEKFWVCPALYNEKSTQKKYKELWDARTVYIATAIDNNNYIKEQELYTYVNEILTSLTNSNKKLLKQQPLLLIDRSSAVNAYAIGGNIIAVNAGLICFAESREEIALVIAHELSHNILQHPDKSMREQAEYFTSPEYKQSLNDVLKEKYERYSRLKKVFQGYSIDRSRHHRYHEGDADSLAIVLLKNSGIGFDARFFLRLDSTDGQYKQPLRHPLKDYFASHDLQIAESWIQKKSKGLSTRNYNFRDTVSMDDSLKTHPDCAARYAATAKASDAGIKLTPVPSPIKEKANRILIWNLFDNMSFTACLYRILLEKDKGSTDAWYDFMMHNILQGLYFADRQLNRFRAIGIVPKEYISKDYYALQTLLEQMPRDNLEQFCATFRSLQFWQKLPADANGLKALMATLNTTDTNSDKAASAAAKNFLKTYNGSMYCEFASHFK
jgi:hypothetical protein